MRDNKAIVVLLSILVFCAIGFVLHQLQAIFLPFVVALFLAQIFAPLVAALRRYVPFALALVVVLLLVTVILFAASWVVYTTVESFAATVPRYQAKLTSALEGVAERIAAVSPWAREQIEQFRWEEAMKASAVTAFIAAGLSSFVLFFNELLLILLFLVFLLAGSEGFPIKLKRAFAEEQAERLETLTANIREQVQRYLLMKTLVNLGHGVLVTALFAAFGVDFPFLWGFVAFLAHYIPNLGAIFSIGLPTVFLFLQFDSPGTALLVTLLNAGIQLFVANAVEPRVMGASLDVSPLLVLFSLIFWGWLWGAWGMVLAVPISATLKIICANVEALKPLAVLMSAKATPRGPSPS
jgi:predicted PurR-regulated permease PerM